MVLPRKNAPDTTVRRTGWVAHLVARREGRGRFSVARPGRLDGVIALSVEEHVWRPGRFGSGRGVTVMVDLTRGADGVLWARLLDMAMGGTGRSRKTCLDAQTPALRSGPSAAPSTPSVGTPTPCVSGKKSADRFRKLSGARGRAWARARSPSPRILQDLEEFGWIGDWSWVSRQLCVIEGIASQFW